MKRMRSWWLAAAACAVLAAALLLPQRFLQQKLDRVAETEFSVDGAEPDMEEAVTLMERLRLAAVGEFIAQNTADGTGNDGGALTAQTQQWLLDAQSVIPQPLRPYIDLSGEVFAESGWILDTASGTVFSAIRASLHHTPFIDTIILLDAQTGRLLHLEMLFYQESDYLILLQDLPDSLEDAGGWLNRVTSYALGDYAAVVAKRLGDRVDTWTTLNEPWCASYLSYGAKEQAPGLGLGPGAFPAVHHLNLAHGLMVQAVRGIVGDKSKYSVTLNMPFNRGDADACHRLDLIANRAFLDPMLRGRYPDELFAITKGICDWSFIQPGDPENAHQPIDVLGVNYYSTNRVAMSDRPQFPQETGPSTCPGASDIDWLPTDGPHTDMGWNIDPQGLYDTLSSPKMAWPAGTGWS